MVIVVKLSDGLGNQMFQYALGRHLAIKSDTELRVDVSWFNNRNVFGGTDRTITLDQFNVKFTLASEDDLKRVIGNPTLSSAFKRYGRFFEYAPQYPAAYFNYYREIRDSPNGEATNWAHRRRFCSKFLKIGPDAYLDGYWQTPLYFADIADTIRKDFTVTDAPTGENAETISQVHSTTAVSVHVRRGDQVQQGPDWAEYGNSLPERYHERAATHIQDRVENPTFFVFSDDSEWAKNNIDFDYPTEYVTQNDSSSDYEDIRLMHNCDHHIIANSTFSWWGAWLNDSNNKIVVAPSPWKRFGYPDGIVEDWDLYPQEWTVLRY